MEKKKVIQILIGFFLGGLLLFSVSYFFVGWLTPVDNLRITAQSIIMEMIGKTYVGDFNTVDGVFVAGKDRITYDELLPYLEHLQVGDILCTESTNFLTAEFTPGKWKHAIIYLGSKEQLKSVYDVNDLDYKIIASHYQTGKEYLILDSSSLGVQIREIQDLSDLRKVSCLKSIIGFGVFTNPDTVKMFINAALFYIGIPYDYDMNTGDVAALYCSELVSLAAKAANLRITANTFVVGREIVSPTNIIQYLMEKRYPCHLYLEKANNVAVNIDVYEVNN